MMFPSELKLITVPNKILNTVSSEVYKITSETRKFMDKMLEVMYENDGIGLAAPQVGVLKRIFCIDVSLIDQDESKNPLLEPICCINPEIISLSKKCIEFAEGCLSVPGKTVKKVRHKEIKVSFLDYHGKKRTMKFDGIASICFQHELDHLNGITIDDE